MSAVRLLVLAAALALAPTPRAQVDPLLHQDTAMALYDNPDCPNGGMKPSGSDCSPPCAIPDQFCYHMFEMDEAGIYQPAMGCVDLPPACAELVGLIMGDGGGGDPAEAEKPEEPDVEPPPDYGEEYPDPDPYTDEYVYPEVDEEEEPTDAPEEEEVPEEEEEEEEEDAEADGDAEAEEGAEATTAAAEAGGETTLCDGCKIVTITWPPPRPAKAGAGAASSSSSGASGGSGGKEHAKCCEWAARGECDRNPYWMRPNCQTACGTAGCELRKAKECKVTVSPTCSAAVGGGGAAASGGGKAGGKDDGGCEDKNKMCQFWKSKEQCEKNKKWMQRNCKKTCGAC